MRTLDLLLIDETPTAPTVIIDDDPEGSLLEHFRDAERLVCISPDYTQARRAADFGAEVAGENRLDSWLSGAGEAVVVGQMPKSLARLEYVAQSVASAGFSQVTVMLGANNKHLSRSMNEVLARSFEHVAASRGRGKFRCLVASGPVPSEYRPKESNGIVAVGGVFSGAREDAGGRLLADAVLEPPNRVLDLGCGNGSVAKRILERFPEAEVTATDSDADAVNSARLTLGESVEVTWDNAGAALEGAFDAVLLNPPFHQGTTVDATLVHDLLRAAHRLTAPGGSTYVVHNSHLRYRGEVDAVFGGSRQLVRDKTFTVLRAQKS